MTRPSAKKKVARSASSKSNVARAAQPPTRSSSPKATRPGENRGSSNAAKQKTVDGSVPERVAFALAFLEKASSQRDRDNFQRFAITTKKAFGVSMVNLRGLAKRLGRDHELALALWDTGWYEARMLATLIDEPARVTAAQMDRWCRDFDNWPICDTACFALFDRTPHAWGKVAAWSSRRDEFQKRAAFALLASLALHDKKAPAAPFVDHLHLVEREAHDARNFVKKGANWALRAVGNRGGALESAAVAMAERLAESEHSSARWIGKDALRELARRGAKRRARES